MKSVCSLVLILGYSMSVVANIPPEKLISKEKERPSFQKFNSSGNTRVLKKWSEIKSPVVETSVAEKKSSIKGLLEKYAKDYKSNFELKKLKEETLKLKNKAVPVLVKVMKTSSFPDKNRWIATFLLGRLMGDKASPFLAKFVEHPYWLLRLASLKTLLLIKDKKYGAIYSKALNDKSLLVRRQALENIGQLNISQYAPQVWTMMFDKRNYSKDSKGRLKRTVIINNVIKTLGDLKYKKVEGHLLKMAQKTRYNDLFKDLDYSLSKMFQKNSPEGTFAAKRDFWKGQIH